MKQKLRPPGVVVAACLESEVIHGGARQQLTLVVGVLLLVAVEAMTFKVTTMMYRHYHDVHNIRIPPKVRLKPTQPVQTARSAATVIRLLLHMQQGTRSRLPYQAVKKHRSRPQLLLTHSSRSRSNSTATKAESNDLHFWA